METLKKIFGIIVLSSAFFGSNSIFADDTQKKIEGAAKSQNEPVESATKQIIYKDLSEAARRVIAAQWANQFSVMIKSSTVDLFSPVGEVRAGVGTGFVAGYDEKNDIGYIVTNRHVAEAGELEAQRIKLFFTDPGNLDEEIDAKVFYIEPPDGDDFAILKFEPSDLKRAQVVSAPIPTFEQMADMYQTGLGVLTHGNPQVERNSVTFGILSQEPEPHFDGHISFKIDAPINPGNSGGPLMRLGFDSALDLHSDAPYVIGINTVKRIGQNVDSMGYAIPTFIWLPKYIWALKGGPEKSKGYLFLKARPITTKVLLLDGLKEIVDAEVKEGLKSSYFEKYRAMVVVDNVQRDSGLEVGDYILSVNGEVIGPDIGNIFETIATTKQKKIPFRVLRDRKVITVNVPITNMKPYEERRKKDFVLLSGIFIQDQLPNERAKNANGRKGVLVNKILWDGMGSNIRDKQGLIDEGALIYEVEIEGIKYPTNTLDQLKNALKNASLNKSIWLRVYNPIINEGTGEPGRYIQNHETSINLIVHELITDQDFSIEALKQKMNLESPIPGTRNWRNLTGMNCRISLSELGRHLKAPKMDFQI